mmetsp:Transcript_62205/g.140688  ORF Transcript_62205/g.140688 Transcript_62205/m.140688 type:complete len:231 (-) Transcript_62205:230-922(-)
MAVTTDLPPAATSRSVRTSAAAEVESRPEVGSSSSTTRALVKSSVPMLVRFFSPPLMRRMGVFAHFSNRRRPTTTSTSWSLRGRLQVLGRRRRAVYVSWSRTDKSSKKRSSCRTYATCRVSFLVMGRAPRVTSPPWYATRPARTSKSVVFPDPLGPIMARISPAFATPDTFWRIALALPASGLVEVLLRPPSEARKTTDLHTREKSTLNSGKGGCIWPEAIVSFEVSIES